MQKQTGIFFVLLLSLISCSNLTSDERQEVVKQQLTDKLQQESKGILTLQSFEKTNGTEMEELGVKMYTMEFTAVITPSQFCIVPGNPFTGYFFQSFHVVLNEPTNGWDKSELSNAKRVQAGQTITLTGVTTLVKKENGWEAGKIKITSTTF